MKKLLALCALLICLMSYAQKTLTPIQGVSVFKIGDTIPRMTEYGYDFTELLLNDDFDYSDGYQILDSGKTLCDKARVFVCEKVAIDEFEFDQGPFVIYWLSRNLKL